MKSAVVTGAADGLGAEIAEALAGAGYRVGVLDIRAELARATAARLDNAVAMEADVTDPESIEQALADFGEVPDLWVNNAGIVRFGGLEEQSFEDYRDTLNVNFMGSCLCARLVAPGMLARGSGHIINHGVTSIMGSGRNYQLLDILGSAIKVDSYDLTPKSTAKVHQSPLKTVLQF